MVWFVLKYFWIDTANFYVVILISFNTGYTSLGCWKDTSNRAIPTLEGLSSFLDGYYGSRTAAIQKCYQAAKSLGYGVFAVQNGGWCASSATAKSTYEKYGASKACRPDGKGGGWANHVYEINQGKLLMSIIIS